MNRSPQAAIIASTYFDYFGSVSYPGEIVVGLRVAKLGRTSVTYEVGVFGKRGDGEVEEAVKAVGGSMHVWVTNEDGVLGRPSTQGMPEAVRRGYESLMEAEALKRPGQEKGKAEGTEGEVEDRKAKL